MRGVKDAGRAPRLIVLENVTGWLTAHKGIDFASVVEALSELGYRSGAIVIDAVDFVPQSRPRVFVIAVVKGETIPNSIIADGPQKDWHPAALIKAFTCMTAETKRGWAWWRLPGPAPRTTVFADLIEETPTGVAWHTEEETAHLLGLMQPVHLEKVEEAKRSGRRMVGSLYRRTRPLSGGKLQCAEVRFDDVAGCLRVPTGGSSRQTVLIVEGDLVRSRLLSPREQARLMGLDDSYRLLPNYNDAYSVAGDGVCVPVVRHIAANLLQPMLRG